MRPRLHATLLSKGLRWFLVATPSLLGCSGAADIPNTPDLSNYQAQFDNPTAALDQNNVVETLNDMPSLREIAAAFRASGYVTTGVNTGSDQETASASRVRVQGSLHVTAQCPGNLEVPIFGENGNFELTLGVDRNLIKRGVGGIANDCALRGTVLDTPVKVTLDGPISFDLGRDLGLRQRWSGRLLMHMAGTVTIETYLFSNLTARWDTDQFEYLYTMPDGSWVIGVLTSQGNVSIRDHDSTWGCSDGQTCVKL
ncbi:MAG TPA: hypothetical protein VGQ57_20500 [Polyangiaceae bacterium]|jgi:hypothetical protein|nr:hypothetical protein [Polyangiaceae bacterium]